MSRTYVGRRAKGSKRVEVLTSGTTTPLVNRGQYRSQGFGWGGQAAGSVSLAHSILADVLGTESSDGMAILFAGDVISTLPEESFALEEQEVRHWLESQLERRMSPVELVEHLGSIALAEPHEEAEVLRGLLDRCWSGQSLTN